MTITEWLKLTEEKLLPENGTARLDAEVLLSDALGKSKAWLLAHPETVLQGESLQKLESQVRRRIEHEPLAYIRGKQEFYGREFEVDNHVLVPRPESETMIELAVKYGRKISPVKIADVGSGSGALGITLSLELPGSTIDLYDIDEATLVVAAKNAQNYNVKARFYASDLLEPNWGPYDIILANLPYVPDSHTINNAAMIEPSHAIFGGEDGLELYRRLFAQLHSFAWKPQVLCTESLPFQQETLAKIASQSGYKLVEEEDFIQVFQT